MKSIKYNKTIAQWTAIILLGFGAQQIVAQTTPTKEIGGEVSLGPRLGALPV